MTSPRRPVLIIDGHGRGDIGVIRSLGLAGIPVHLLTSAPGGPAAASRWVRRQSHAPPWSAPAALVEHARAYARDLGERPVMMFTGDRCLRLFIENREAFEEVVDHDVAPTQVVETCLDKVRFAHVATELELPVPDTVAPASLAELEGALPGLTFPVFVKPADRASWAGLPRGTVYTVKGTQVDTGEDLLRLYRILVDHDAHAVVVQSLVHGPASNHISVHAYRSADGQVRASFSARKPRVWPAHAGVACIVTSTRIPEVLRLATEALERLEYTGFAIVQFKQTGQDQYRLLEINCRFSTWTEMPTRAGVNFPAISYAEITGGATPPVSIEEGLSWWDARRDLSTFRAYRSSGEETVWSYLRSLASVRAFAYFAFDDPKPLFTKLRTAPRD